MRDIEGKEKRSLTDVTVDEGEVEVDTVWNRAMKREEMRKKH